MRPSLSRVRTGLIPCVWSVCVCVCVCGGGGGGGSGREFACVECVCVCYYSEYTYLQCKAVQLLTNQIRGDSS